MEESPLTGLVQVEVVRDQDTLRTNALVAELLPLPGLEIAREVQLYSRVQTPINYG